MAERRITGSVNEPGRVRNSPGRVDVWANFDGTGTPALTVSFNCSSIGDNGTGNHTVNFTKALSSSSYCVITNTFNVGALLEITQPGSLATGSVVVRTFTATSTTDTTKAAVDAASVYVACYGN